MPNYAQLHLMLNHAPFFLGLAGALVLFYGSWIRSDDVLRVALALLMLAGVLTVPVYYTGTGAEGLVEELEGVTHDSIEAHEEEAAYSYYAALALGVYSFAGLYFYAGREFSSVLYVAGAGFLAAVLLMTLVNTAYLGGKINHPELEIPSRLLQ